MRCQVALVTGASRGIGKGIAAGLGEMGATVYLSARTLDGGSVWPGSLLETAELVEGLGGRGIPLPCDHDDDRQVQGLFQKIREDVDHLDLLVNCATGFGDSGSGYPPDSIPFWEQPLAVWDEMHRVGLRSHYVASAFAVPLLIAARGLVVNVSSAGAVHRASPAYGAAKAGLDKLTADMAHDFRRHGVAVVSIWPTLTLTEKVLAHPELYELERARSPLFTGRVVAGLLRDAGRLAKSGRALTVEQLAGEYGISDSPVGSLVHLVSGYRGRFSDGRL